MKFTTVLALFGFAASVAACPNSQSLYYCQQACDPIVERYCTAQCGTQPTCKSSCKAARKKACNECCRKSCTTC